VTFINESLERSEYERRGGITGAVWRILAAKLPPETELALRVSYVRHFGGRERGGRIRPPPQSLAPLQCRTWTRSPPKNCTPLT